jgi:hypothetical protein
LFRRPLPGSRLRVFRKFLLTRKLRVFRSFLLASKLRGFWKPLLARRLRRLKIELVPREARSPSAQELLRGELISEEENPKEEKLRSTGTHQRKERIPEVWRTLMGRLKMSMKRALRTLMVLLIKLNHLGI